MSRVVFNFILVLFIVFSLSLPLFFCDIVSADGCTNTGGTIIVDGDYTYHVFNLSQTGTNFSVCKAGNIEILVVGGGGGGGWSNYAHTVGGGGGAGGVTYNSSYPVTVGNYTVTVGGGGATGVTGGNSSFGTLIGGGGGGGGQVSNGGSGLSGYGSGGGGAGADNAQYYAGLAGGIGLSYDGGNGYRGTQYSYVAAGGGGGAGAVGTAGVKQGGGDGGAGVSTYSSLLSVVGIGQNISGTWWIAGGGGGGNGASARPGGNGGGGAGGFFHTAPIAGTADSGGGGGGRGTETSSSAGASGGSGIVIIRYLTEDFTEIPIVYLVTSSSIGGDVTTPGEGTYAYNVSDVVDILAIADGCYHFVNWTGDTANISDVNEASTTINMGTSNQTAVANFAINTSVITYLAGANGTLNNSTPQTVNCGTDTTDILATANSCYHFVDWDDSSIDNPRHDTGTSMNQSFIANFAIDVKTVEYVSGANGTVNGSWPEDVDCGDDSSWVLAIPSDGYYFLRWSDDSTTNPRHETNVISNLSYTASFALSGTNASAVIPSSGGTITTADGDVSILFPSGAFLTNTIVTIEGMSCHPSTDNYIVAGTCFEIDSDSDLHAPAKICVNVSDYDKNNITIGYWGIIDWIEADDIDLDGNLLCGNTSHFSDWSILYKNINGSGSATIDSMTDIIPIIFAAILIIAVPAALLVFGGFSIVTLILGCISIVIGLSLLGTLTNLISNMW